MGRESVRAIISASNNKSAPTQAEEGAERADPLIPDAGQSAVLAADKTNGASNRYGCATEQRDPSRVNVRVRSTETPSPCAMRRPVPTC